jgi:hypothetical protein
MKRLKDKTRQKTDRNVLHEPAQGQNTAKNPMKVLHEPAQGQNATKNRRKRPSVKKGGADGGTAHSDDQSGWISDCGDPLFALSN